MNGTESGGGRPSRVQSIEPLIRLFLPVTQAVVALLITGGFIRLALKEIISGDSYTNVMFLVAGFLFGKAADALTRPVPQPSSDSSTITMPKPPEGSTTTLTAATGPAEPTPAKEKP
jgi:hypothetical protein